MHLGWFGTTARQILRKLRMTPLLPVHGQFEKERHGFARIFTD